MLTKNEFRSTSHNDLPIQNQIAFFTRLKAIIIRYPDIYPLLLIARNDYIELLRKNNIERAEELALRRKNNFARAE